MDNNTLVVSGTLYPVTATVSDILVAEALAERTPLVITETTGGTTVIGSKDLKAADPMAHRILRAHLGGEWLMIIPQDGKGPSLTDRELYILEAMPLEWGEHKELAELLYITRRQLQYSLEKLVAKELIERPWKGYYRRL